VKTAAVRIQAEAETHVGTVVFRKDCPSLFLKDLKFSGRRRIVVFQKLPGPRVGRVCDKANHGVSLY
jgi:hypothetical protein